MEPMRALLPLALLCISGCATTPRLLPAKVSGNEVFVAVYNVWNVRDALPYATRHCAQYGKVPRPSGMEGITARFDCVRAD
jgi:hypothetical protein